MCPVTALPVRRPAWQPIFAGTSRAPGLRKTWLPVGTRTESRTARLLLLQGRQRFVATPTLVLRPAPHGDRLENVDLCIDLTTCSHNQQCMSRQQHKFTAK